MEGKGISFIILLVIVALLSLTLAGLAFYVFISASNPKVSAEPINTKQTVKKVYKDEEVTTMKLFEGKKFFNLKVTDDKKISVIQVGVEVKYRIKVTGIKSMDAKLKAYEGEFKEYISSYFQGLTLEEAKLPDTKVKAKEEIKAKFNNLLTENEEKLKKEEIVTDVIFTEWLYQ